MPSPENDEAEEGEMVRGSSAPSDEVSFKSEAARIDDFQSDFTFFRRHNQQMRKMRRRCCHLL